jgi:glycosyltransferase involved in cell wall biosynthesis
VSLIDKGNQVIKILILTDSFIGGAGGSEKHIKDLLQDLSKVEYQVDIVQLSNTLRIPFPEGTKLENRTYHHIPVKRVYGITGLLALKKLTHLVKSKQIDITLSFHEMSDILNALIPNRCIKLSSRRDMGFKRNSLLEQVIRFVNKKFTYILCPSIAVQNKVLSEGVSLDKTYLLYNGIDCNKFPTIQSHNLEQRSALLSEIGITPGDINIICIGNLNEWKGHKYLIEALSKVRDINCQLVLFGDGATRSVLEQQVAELNLENNVHFYGYSTEVKRYISAFDLMVLPSLTEGLSNALLEGVASGLPLIATSVGGNPEVIQDNTNGQLVEPSNASSIADAIPLFSPSRVNYQQISLASRKIAEDKFSLAAMLENYHLLFTKLIENKRA